MPVTLTDDEYHADRLNTQLTTTQRKLDAAVGALMESRRSYTQPPMRAVSMTECIVSIEALDALVALAQIEGEGEEPACDHDWVRIEGNPLVTNGAMCARCHQIAAASDVLKGCGE